MRELRRRLQADRPAPPFEPCLPKPATQPPAGPGWLHEIKHDGFRNLAHRQGHRVRLLTSNGRDLADRFPLAVEAIAALPVKSCVIDGEGIVCNDNGLALFDLIRGHGRNGRAILCAFDLLEVAGEDIRSEPIENRKRRLAGLPRLPHEGIALNETYRDDGAPFTSMLARSAARASSQSGSAIRTAPAASIIGLRSRIRRRRP